MGAILAAALSLLVLSPAAVEAGRADGSGAGGEGEKLERINAALRDWLGAASAGSPYLLVDTQQGRVQLRQGGALLRDCRIGREHLGATGSARQILAQRIRRHRRSDPYSEPQSSAFDWEDYLSVAATPDGALYFSEGLLMYASEKWGEPRAPSLKMSEDDLVALYDALPVGTVLVVLPPGWRAGDRGAAIPTSDGGRE